MVLCRLPPNNSSSSQAVAVSLVTTTQCERPRNVIDLVDLRQRRRQLERHLRQKRGAASSKRRVDDPANDNRMVDFTVCVSPLWGEQLDVRKLVEFIEVNRIFGAEKFVFYVESAGEEVIRCLQKYVGDGFVEVTLWNSIVVRDLYYHGQFLAISECLYRSMYRTRYLISQDLDEFIVPTEADSWQGMLDHIHIQLSISSIDSIASYNFRNLFIPLHTQMNTSANVSYQNQHLLTLAHTYTDIYIYRWTDRSKVMARPERILIWYVHEIYTSSLVVEGDVNYYVNETDGLLFHYRDIEVTLSANPNRRMHKFADKISSGVETGLEICQKLTTHNLAKPEKKLN